MDHAKTAKMKDRGSRTRAPKLRRLVLVHPQHSRFEISGTRLTIGRGADRDIVLADPAVSKAHAELTYVSEYDVWRLANASSNGTFVSGTSIETEFLQPGAVVRMGDSLLVYAEAEVPTEALAPAIVERERSGWASIGRVVAEHLASLIAISPEPVLITGPTGAGKERIARQLHDESGASGAWVDLNCGAFSRELLGSELFGHVKGAFTGALSDREGAFVRAKDGTVFLDEIGDLPADQQAAFLRVLQERVVRPLGGDRNIKTHARVVAATSRDLSDPRSFRTDLLARLSIHRIELPGLAERKDEVLPLFSHFLGREDLPLSIDAAEAMLSFGWPHNVREVQSVAAAVRLFADRVKTIELSMLPAMVRGALDLSDSTSTNRKPNRARLDALLREHAGNVSRVADALGEHRTQVNRWIKAEGLDPADYR